jgi:hypothetical protein
MGESVIARTIPGGDHQLRPSRTEALRRIQNVVADRELRVDLGRCRLCGAPATVELFAGHCLCRQCCDRLAA